MMPEDIEEMYMNDWREWVMFLGQRAKQDSYNRFLPINDLAKHISEMLKSKFGGD